MPPSPPFSVVVASFPTPSLFTPLLQKTSERTEIEVQVLVLQPERRLQLVHPLGEAHERQPQPLDLLVGQPAFVHPPKRLALHQLAQELDQREDELREAAFHLLGVGGHPLRKRVVDAVQALGDEVEVAGCGEQPVELVHAASSCAKLYAGHGPVQTTGRSWWRAAKSLTSERTSPTRAAGTRYAAVSCSRASRSCTVACASRAIEVSLSWRRPTVSRRRRSPSRRRRMYAAPLSACSRGGGSCQTRRPTSTQSRTRSSAATMAGIRRRSDSASAPSSSATSPKRTGRTAVAACASASTTAPCVSASRRTVSAEVGRVRRLKTVATRPSESCSSSAPSSPVTAGSASRPSANA